MATWDGSYAEDPSYLVYSDQSMSDKTTAGNWPHFAGNPAYLPNASATLGRNYYPAAGGGRHLYGQNNGSVSALRNQVAADGVLPSMPSTMVPVRNPYQEHILPSTASVNSPSDGLQYSANSIASTSHSASFFHGNNQKAKYRKRRTTNSKHTLSAEGDSVRSDIVENSKLHATANEFVPNNVKFKRDKFSKWNGRSNAPGNSFNASAQAFRSKSFAMNASLLDNRYKNESYFNNRRDGNYKQRNSQQSMQALPRSSYNDRSYNKFQNGKYHNRKHQSDVSSVGDAHTSTTELGVSAASNSQQTKASIEEFQKDDSSLNTEMSTNREVFTGENNDPDNASLLKVDTQRSRSKRFNTANSLNYSKSDFYDDQSESRYNKTMRYPRRRNEANTSKEKLDNWRDKKENKDTAQGKSLSKKYEIDDDASQRERLMEQLNRGILECLVCYEHIKHTDYVWSCSNCYHVLHLKCIKKWAKSSQSGE
ncbi:hypothetical protein DMN91_008057 [Ooceraea biroi]|uniref:RING-type domain-containing protein n=1 Tax=Ooceraea biroi TaxID=2015173 RepID=A0A3L8DGD3_OOCBI|nr:hypothetical protein DMN91_008057 [Ooceraea biroi]